MTTLGHLHLPMGAPRPIFKLEVRDLIWPKDNTLILDIGCNDGTDSAEFVSYIPGCVVHCFEPDPRPIARFKEMRKSKLLDGRLFLHEMAIGDHDGTTTLHMSGGHSPGGAGGPPVAAHLIGLHGNHTPTGWDASGSIHKPTGHLDYSPWVTFDKTCEVKLARLDTWAAENGLAGATIDYIHADTQGAEHDMIAGGTETLARTRFLYSEFYDRPMYEGQKPMRELLAMLGPHWQLLGIFEGCNFLVKNTLLG